jgi:hypothetical protein
METM